MDKAFPCEKCGKASTVHLTEISGGKPHDIHLCNACAQEAGHIQQSHVPINELLNQFLKSHAQVSDAGSLHCIECGMTWQEFKDSSLLGCQHDYVTFEPQLQGVIERAQQGATHHTGKTPPEKVSHEDPVKLRQAELRKLQKDLARAVEDESYEAAARLRDEIRKLEAGGR